MPTGSSHLATARQARTKPSQFIEETIFHTYVVASTGRKFDFDRARLLMDDDLLARVERDIPRSPPSARDDGKYKRVLGEPRKSYVQAIWDGYCSAHAFKHGEPFEPDISMTWDQ